MLGVSPDPVKPIAKFADKFDLGFTLLSDEDHSVAESYGVWVEKSMYGRTYMGNERTTFVIDADGKIKPHLPQGQAGGARRQGARRAVGLATVRLLCWSDRRVVPAWSAANGARPPGTPTRKLTPVKRG